MTMDVCAIGNACMDIISQVDDAFLEEWKFPKGICTYFGQETSAKLFEALPAPLFVSGGCGANTADVVASLGGKASFIGRIADDKMGHMFLKDLTDKGIRYTGVLDRGEKAGTTEIFTFVTPDAERTFGGHYSELRDLGDEDLDMHALTTAKFLYLDGYTLNTRRADKFFLSAAQVSKKAGNKIVFAPCDLSILKEFDDIVEVMTGVSDAIMCSAEEALYLTKAADLDSAIAHLRTQFSFGAVTAGARGAFVFDQNGLSLVPPATLKGRFIDANGAGDAFAGGFLYGLARDFPIERAAALGNLCASRIITHYGARPQESYQPLLTQV